MKKKKVTLAKHVSTKKTAQTVQMPGRDQVQNDAGGFVFALDKWSCLRKFLLLGTEGGTYYVSEQKMTVDAAKNVIECIKEDGERVIKETIDISVSGRAHKNDPAIFVLAMVMTYGKPEAKIAAYASISKVCRIGTHLFSFCDAIQNLRGWSRGLRRGVANWYNAKSADELAVQLIKYRQRNGWTHRDAIRLSHPTGSDAHKSLYQWACGKNAEHERIRTEQETLLPQHSLIKVFEETIKMGKGNIKEICKNITDHNLPWEALNTEVLREPKIWETLIPNMPLKALIRNLGRIANIGVTKTNLDEMSKVISERLGDQNTLSRSRIHPVDILFAYNTYSQGRGFRGEMTWSPVQKIVDALDEAFRLTFPNVQGTGKNVIIALDSSGSMKGRTVANSALSATDVCGAMAMVYAATEKNHEILSFADNAQKANGFTPKMTLREAIQKAHMLPSGGTDGSAPIRWAHDHKVPVDAFVLYSDGDTWAGQAHVCQALEKYRKTFNPDAKIVVMSVTSRGYSMTDTKDPGSMDIVGFDPTAPQVANEFIKGF